MMVRMALISFTQIAPAGAGRLAFSTNRLADAHYNPLTPAGTVRPLKTGPARPRWPKPAGEHPESGALPRAPPTPCRRPTRARRSARFYPGLDAPSRTRVTNSTKTGPDRAIQTRNRSGLMLVRRGGVLRARSLEISEFHSRTLAAWLWQAERPGAMPAATAARQSTEFRASAAP